MSNDLTETINEKIRVLKTEVNSLPNGGGFEGLKTNLHKIQLAINGLVNKIDDVEHTLTGLDPNRF